MPIRRHQHSFWKNWIHIFKQFDGNINEKYPSQMSHTLGVGEKRDEKPGTFSIGGAERDNFQQYRRTFCPNDFIRII
jgi:hypothetical protein